MKRLSFLVSMPFFGALFILLIVVLAVGTFIESGYNTHTAWAVIYGARWFEVLLLLIAVNLVGNLFRYHFFLPGRPAVLIFHVAFLLILGGAAITRYISTEGSMRIREGSATNKMISNTTFVDVKVEGKGTIESVSKEVRLSTLTPHAFRASLHTGGEKMKIRSAGVISNAVEQYIAAPGGTPLLQMLLVTDRQYQLSIPDGEYRMIPAFSISLNNPEIPATLKVFSKGEQLFAFSDSVISVMTMGGGEGSEYAPGDTIPVERGKLMSAGATRFVLQKYMSSARKEFVQASGMDRGGYADVIRFEVEYRGMRSNIYVQGMPGLIGQPATVMVGDQRVSISYGAREIELPFALMLRDFEVERYPGSHSPSSFASEVTLIDKEREIMENRRIFMNNVLKHRGYRFYQSSYDTDEKGTVLSVNKDYVGTFVTYLGYFFMMLGMFLALFTGKTRFKGLAKLSSRGAASMLALVLLLSAGGGIQAQQPVPPADEAASFGKLWVQGKEGRFKPVTSLSSEILRKIVKHSSYEGYTADQVVLGMALYPDAWRDARLFEVKNEQLQQMLGNRGEMLSFNDFFDMTGEGSYLLSELVNAAYSKQVQDRNDLDKEVIKLDERINVMYMVQTGGLWRIFPDPGSEDHTWLSIADLMEQGHSGHKSEDATLFFAFLRSLESGDYARADSALTVIAALQAGEASILPSETHKKAEILYNKLGLFEKLAIIYGLLGIALLILQFVLVFKPGKNVKLIFRIGVFLLGLAFILHLFAFLLRWYVSGHAPLSNGFESMIFVSLISVLSGLVFVKRSGFSVGLTSFLAALALLVAHMSWMNPDITNLVPVLKSTWLTIHVMIVMSGYGFLGLSALLGLLALVFYALLDENGSAAIKEVIEQITRVNQLTMIVGLYFMTAGVFLGGVWANESWGRYWGWDPKETWALITVLAYAFVAHMNNIPGLRGNFALNLGSFASYSTVLMTYFGVNYFLGGIHSYASGSPFEIPVTLYLVLIAFVLLGVIAHRKWKKYLGD